jgi:pyruvate/2-oxoglutarate dehydrogenase complex dihydrolipoamide acyltransferase (E2) component
MDVFNKMPRFISRSLLKFVTKLDKRGRVPQFLIETDPYYSTVLLSNVGSIKLGSGYHHLTNWGTTSLFIIIGEMKECLYYDENGNREARMSVDIGLTVDERISDGYYCSKSIRLLKKLPEEPELLEQPLGESIEY